MVNENKRIVWIDAAKALAVYLVILGHLVIFNYTTFRFIFTFHMPVFFFIAGYVFGNKEKRKFSTFLYSQMKYYLLPYGIILLMGVIQCYLFPTQVHNANNIWTQENVIKTFYMGYPVFSYFGSAWFLLAMFEAQIIFYWMEKLWSKGKKVIVFFTWVLILLLALNVKEIFSWIPFFQRLPLKMDSALMAVCFMKLGQITFHYGFLEKIKKFYAIILTIVGAFGVWFLGCKNNYYVNMCDCDYAKHVNFLLAAVCGICMVVGISICIQKIRILQYIGKHTLFIFLSHEIVYLFLIELVNRVWNKTFLAQKMKLDGWSIGISLATLAITTFICWIAQIIKKELFTVKKKS